MKRLCTAAQMRALERDLIDRVGVPALALMEVAGRGVAELCVRLSLRRVLVLCGPGNNGGDGFVVARLLHGRGLEVAALALFERAAASGDGAVMRAAAEKSGVSVEEITTDAALDAALARHANADLVIDALLGTGLGRAVDGLMARAIAGINAHRGCTVAVDLPSGLDADRGVPLGSCVRADHTVTFGLPKIGLCSSPGHLSTGELHVVDIGIPEAAIVAQVQDVLLDGSLLDRLKQSDPRDHKGTHGHVLVLAGSVGKSGAALLCATAAQRSGAGLVTMLAPADLRSALEARTLALMQYFFDHAPDNAALDALLVGKRAVAVGPGLATDAVDLVRRMLHRAHAAEVRQAIDAEALNAIADDVSVLPAGDGNSPDRVLLPHPGEAARLLGRTTVEVESARLVVARELAARYSSIVVLKGARTIIAAPDGRVAICPAGGPALGTGGSGDVLCGMVAALLARSPRIDSFDAAAIAVYWHGRAGDALAARMPVFIADDLLASLASILA